jgi:predicted dehydrogenase
MTSRRERTIIGTGIIGANPSRGWALAAHIPALKALPGYAIRAVSASRLESAERSAQALGIVLAFDNHRDLLARSEIDLAIVSVKVPHHYELATAALAAGKMVFCEWPLGRNLKEAEEIAALARQKGLKTVVGLQGRFAPAVRYLRDLVADGYVGKLLGTSMVGSSDAWDGVVDAASEYLADANNGATLLAIAAGHAVDALCFALGEFKSVSSTLIARRGQAVRLPDSVPVPMTTHDQIAFSGTLENGALASVHYRGGSSKGHDFVWEINGTDGDIILTTEQGYVNISELKIQGAQGDGPLEVLTIPAEYRIAPAGVTGAAVNVAALYAQFARDLAEGTRLTPDFDAAVQRHRLIDAIERSNTTGMRQTL